MEQKSLSEPIFIVGPPRSGTTLMANMLGRHSRIFMPGETHYFDDIYSRKVKLGSLGCAKSKDKIMSRLKTLYGRYNEPKDQTRIDGLWKEAFTTTKVENINTHKELFTYFMDVQMIFEGKQRWGNHTPRDIFSIDEIKDIFPGAKVLVCVRDVRDFMVSYKGKWRATTSEEKERIRSLYHPVTTALLWKSTMRKIAATIDKYGRGDLYISKYEDLVLDPRKRMKDICGFLGESYEEGMLDIDSNNSSHGRAGSGIYKESVNGWRGRLEEEEVFIAQSLNRKEMQRYGYEEEATSVRAGSLLMYIGSFPIRVLQALYNNRAHYGPLIPYLRKRLGMG